MWAWGHGTPRHVQQVRGCFYQGCARRGDRATGTWPGKDPPRCVPTRSPGAVPAVARCIPPHRHRYGHPQLGHRALDLARTSTALFSFPARAEQTHRPPLSLPAPRRSAGKRKAAGCRQLSSAVGRGSIPAAPGGAPGILAEPSSRPGNCFSQPEPPSLIFPDGFNGI